MISFEEICTRFPNIDGILLIHESKFDPSRKTYLLDDILIKSRKIDEDQSEHLRANDLEKEYNILIKCSVINGIPQALYYSRNNNFENLLLTFVPGVQLEYLKLNLFQFISVLWKLFKLLFKLSARRVSHNDVVPLNILVTEDLKVSLVDFDQAIVTSGLKALAGNYIGIKTGKSKVSYSMLTVIKDFLRKKFPNTIYGLKQILNKNKTFEDHKLPEIEENAVPELKKMLKAWKIAQKSNASSPALPLAYYAIDFEGYHFPGERPWNERWNRLKNVSAYSGKTILELGCNMGLLSIHLLKEAGAAKCIGVDHDKKILESAKLISEVYEVKPLFKQINFDSARDWESDLSSYKIDIVFALNVLNWVNDKERLLRFSSNFPEIIFEGHDSIEVERKRFEQIGFNTIEEIGYSERERIILRCRK